MFQPDTAATSCSSCGAGTYSSSPASQACNSCPANSTSPPAVRKYVPCTHVNMYMHTCVHASVNMYMHTCVHASLHVYVPCVRPRVCACAACAVHVRGNCASLRHAWDILAPFDFGLCQSDSPSQCRCSSGYWLIATGCVPCPHGAVCHADSTRPPYPQKGFWGLQVNTHML